MQAKPQRPIINPRHPLARGLLGAWPMLRHSSTGAEPNIVKPGLYDLSPNSSPTPLVGKHGWQFGYDGSANWHSSTSFASVPGSPVSVFVLVNIQRLANNEIVVGRNASFSLSVIDWYFIIDLAGARLLWLTKPAGNGVYAISSQSNPTTGWHSILCTWNGGVGVGAANMWVDGLPTTNGQGGAGFNTTAGASLSVGAAANGNGKLQCQIADLRIWNRVLNNASARSLLADPWAMYRAPKFTIGKAPSGAITSHPYYYRNFVNMSK